MKSCHAWQNTRAKYTSASALYCGKEIRAAVEDCGEMIWTKIGIVDLFVLHLLFFVTGHYKSYLNAYNANAKYRPQ